MSEWKWVWWNLCHGPTEKDDFIRELRRDLEATKRRESELRSGGWVMRCYDIAADRDRWYKIASDLYDKVMIAYCWHCGSEKVRNCYVDNVADEFRQAVVDREKYNLVGLTTKDLGNERYEAADEIERLRAENDGLRVRIYSLLKKLEEQAVRGG